MSVTTSNSFGNAMAGAMSPGMQLRASRIEMVRQNKNLKLTFSERFCKYLGSILLLPTLGLAGIISVPPKTTLAVFRFGKLDRVISTPGLAWLLPFSEIVSQFTGTQTYRMDQLQVIDSTGEEGRATYRSPQGFFGPRALES